MELPGTGYLYTLAGIAMTFVGFTVLIAVLRQTLSGHVTAIHIFATRMTIQLGLMTVLGSMLAPLLALSTLPAAAVWRLSSAVMAVILSYWTVTYPKRRIAASPVVVPPLVWALIGILGLGDVALIANAAAPWGDNSVVLYAGGVSSILFVAAMLFLAGLWFLIANEPLIEAPKRRRKP